MCKIYRESINQLVKEKIWAFYGKEVCVDSKNLQDHELVDYLGFFCDMTEYTATTDYEMIKEFAAILLDLSQQNYSDKVKQTICKGLGLCIEQLPVEFFDPMSAKVVSVSLAFPINFMFRYWNRSTNNLRLTLIRPQ